MIAAGWRTLALMAVFVSCCASPGSAAAAAVGAKAPSFILDGLDGAPVESAAFAGRPLYVNVFATWCPPCRHEMPLIARTLPQYSKQIAFLAVDAQETAGLVAPFLTSVGVRAKVAIDQGQFAASYGAKSIPESVFIDRRGIVRAIVHGPIDEKTLRKNLALIQH